MVYKSDYASSANCKKGKTMHNVALMRGDGIGPEITDAAVEIVESTGPVEQRRAGKSIWGGACSFGFVFLLPVTTA